MERLERAATKKKFLEVISAMQQLFHHDHSYGCLTTTVESCGMKKDVPYTQQHLINKLYQNHVCLSSEACAKLEANTRAQSQSESWHCERKLRITASLMKEVCH